MTHHASSRVTLVAVSMMVRSHVVSKPVADRSSVPISKTAKGNSYGMNGASVMSVKVRIVK